MPTFRSAAPDAALIHYHAWPLADARAAVVIAHGAAEHGLRYARLASALNAAGIAAFAIDHRGHGRSAAAGRLGVFADGDGWNRAVGDLRTLVDRVGAEQPGVPVCLLGHSLGSLMAQQYIAEHGESIAACALSGSTVADAFAALRPLVEAEVAEHGRDGPCRTLGELMGGGGFNAGIESPRTGFDWLSRDAAEVDAYIADPLCGFELSSGAWLDLLAHGRIPADAAACAAIPRALPLYVFAGACDPVSDNAAAIAVLLQRYADAGLQRVESRIYPGARHETLNETDRAQVTADLLAWLERVL